MKKKLINQQIFFRNNKAAVVDIIITEYIKSNAHLLLPCYFKLFNGVYPEKWLLGIIRGVASGWTGGQVDRWSPNQNEHKKNTLI